MAVYSGSTGDGGAPTNRFVLAWKPNLRDEPTEVEGTFTDDGGRTRVDLEHRSWERLGEPATRAREGYTSGWTMILQERPPPCCGPGP